MSGVSALLQQGSRLIELEQLRTGEMPTYFAAGNGLVYLRSPLLSTFVHEALACFDPGSPLGEPETLELLAPRQLPAFSRTVAGVRRRIRAFLAWDEHSDGTWRYFGRGSGVPADADTTARAATALLDAPPRSPRRRWLRHLEALQRLRAADGTFPGPLPPAGEDLRPGPDPVGNAHALRFLALTGEDAGGLVNALGCALQDPGAGPSSGRYPGALACCWALVHAWCLGRLPGADALGDRLVPWLLTLEIADGDFGGPLSTALALAVLLDLRAAAGHLERVRGALLRQALARGGWPYQAFLRGAGGSPSLTTSLALAALARATVALGGSEP